MVDFELEIIMLQMVVLLIYKVTDIISLIIKQPWHCPMREEYQKTAVLCDTIDNFNPVAEGIMFLNGSPKREK